MSEWNNSLNKFHDQNSWVKLFNNPGTLSRHMTRSESRKLCTKKTWTTWVNTELQHFSLTYRETSSRVASFNLRAHAMRSFNKIQTFAIKWFSPEELDVRKFDILKINICPRKRSFQGKYASLPSLQRPLQPALLHEPASSRDAQKDA